MTGTNDKVPVLDHAPETANPSGDVTDTGKPEEEVQVSGEGSQTAGSDTDTRTVNSNENNGTDSGLREQFVKPNNDIGKFPLLHIHSYFVFLILGRFRRRNQLQKDPGHPSNATGFACGGK